MKRPRGGQGQNQPKRTRREADEVTLLESALEDLRGQGTETQAAAAKRFDELPISEYTKEGLKEAGFTRLTAVQRAAILPALAGRDLLGAAKTGSGKTLAFLVPVCLTVALHSPPPIFRGICSREGGGGGGGGGSLTTTLESLLDT